MFHSPATTSQTNSTSRLAKLATRAEKVVKPCPKQNRKSIREFLREDGVAGQIDGIVKELLPEYVGKPNV